MRHIVIKNISLVEQYRKVILVIFSALLNLLGFMMALSSFNCVFATNDDFRMRSIVSGAYTGTPSPYTVFMKYPVGWLLSMLYTILPKVSWYGLFLMTCYFIPSCVLLYFILSRCQSAPQFVFSFFIYAAFFLFVVQKHIIIPQFTTASAFLASGALVVLFYFYKNKGKKSIIQNGLLFAFFCGSSFCVRMKIFFLFLPIMGFIIIWDIGKNKKEWKKYICLIAMAASVCLVFGGIDFFNTNTEEYKEYAAFNSGRSKIYDYYSVPEYVRNEDFYSSIGVDETVYRAILARYLDVDPVINVETYNEIIEHQLSVRGAKSLSQMILNAVNKTTLYFTTYYSASVFFQTVFAFIFLIVVIMLSFINKKFRQSYISLCLIPLAILEIFYLTLEGRIMSRIIESMAVQMSVLSMVSFQFSGAFSDSGYPHFMMSNTLLRRVLNTIAIGSVFVVVVFSAISCQYSLKTISNSANKQRERLSLMNSYTQNNPDIFILYDSYDFMSASASVFNYEDSTFLRSESLGNWYIKSPDYYKRLNLINAESSLDALMNNPNIYYASINDPKLGMKLLLKRKYNCDLVQCDKIVGSNLTITLYQVVKSE